MARIGTVAAGVAAWSVGAATAVGVGLVALSLVGGPRDSPLQPISPNALGQPADPTTTATVAPTGQPTTNPVTSAPPAAPPQSDRTVVSQGGTVLARCKGDIAYLVGWSPAPGFRADDVSRGPAAVARVTFTNRSSEVKVTIRCAAGLVEPTITQDDDDDHHGSTPSATPSSSP